jgi:phage terminase large subunit GpA-like protein
LSKTKTTYRFKVVATRADIDLKLTPDEARLIEGLLRGLKPDPLLTVSQWADEFRILPDFSASPGPFRVRKTPYLQEIMDKLSVSDPAQNIVFKKCSQIGGTETGNNWLGYIIDIAPSAMLYIMPTDTMMKLTSKTRIQPMINETPALQRKIKPSRSRDSGNTIMTKEFEGGFVNMVGANSPNGLSSLPVRYVYFDETDRYPGNVKGEGDVISLGETRTSTFGARKKVFKTSTPTLKGSSIIAKAYEATGQREFYVPCPHCASLQVLRFERLRYEVGKYDNVTYECEHCNEQIHERHKTRMLENGTWIARFPDKEDGITFGYHINALYSPYGWYSWGQMAKDYEEALTDLPKMIAFTNTKKGEEYEAEGDAPQWEVLYSKASPDIKVGTPSEHVVFITVGVDIQKDRIELEIVGWGKGKQSWSIDYRVLVGSTDSETNEVWNSLSLVLDESFTREDGAVLPVHLMAVDTGYNTSVVYDFCRRHPGRVIPIKGQDKQSMIVSPPRAVDTSRAGKKINGVKVWNVGVSMVKTQLYGWLKLFRNEDGTYPNGYCHFPQYDSHYFKGLASEKLTSATDKKGYTTYVWNKHFERNEPLDCRVYARAAANVLNIDRFTDEAWDKLWLDTKDQVPAVQQAVEAKPKKKASSFWNR